MSSAEEVEKTVSLEDINKENRELKELEADARAVLGNSDENNCTWNRGYVTRQALYACVTCRPNPKDPSTRAGVCLACSYHCHDGHELVELYTKRDFRCDCGNLKFHGEVAEGGGDANRKLSVCQLLPDEKRENTENTYNQNYDGVYCTCGKPYPDPDDTVEDDMIQCVVCEDWYHSRHLRISENFNGGKFPEDYHEMICQLCSAANPFLASYANGGDLASVTTVVGSSSADSTVDVETTDSATNSGDNSDDASRKRKLSGDNRQANGEVCRMARWKKSKPNESAASSTPYSSSSSFALFFAEGWRSKLCSCAECKQMYEERKISYLAREEDSVGAYEAAGAAANGGLSGEEEEEAALGNLLGDMDRFQQGELIAGYNDMKSSLQDYLRKFAEEGKVVTADDIRSFFQDMEAKKKDKGGPQYFCG